MIDDKDYPEFRAGGSYDALADPEALLKLANMKMPFGKYAGRYLVDLPENYVLWFKQKGFPEGDLGRQMSAICEIQANGLEDLLRPLRRY